VTEENREPSDDFLSAVREHRLGGGGIWDTCDHCGRTYFASDAGFDYEPGELEGLQEKAEKEPGKYIDTGEVAVGHIEFSGMKFLDCCECNALRRYEDFIWRNRVVISNYLEKRIERELREIADEADHIWRSRSAVNRHCEQGDEDSAGG
jgi:hypothetical protein